MNTKIFPIPLGFDCCYLIQAKGNILIDGGAPGKAKDFEKIIQKISINPQDIKLIVITHGHWDHIGSVKDIKEITGAKIALHENEKDWLEKSLMPLPNGVTTWGRIFGGVMTMFKPLIEFPPTTVDIVLGDEGLDLNEYGIPGKIIHTPGHSHGSVGVLLETGEVFVGDLAMNKFPLRLSPGLPIFADDIEIVKKSWKLLLDQGAKIVYPAHGKPFSAEIIRKAISR